MVRIGAVQVETYNQRLMESISYSRVRDLKKVLRMMNELEKACARGDQVAGAIMVDIKTCLGYYGKDQTILDDQQIMIIRMNLIEGIPQEEIAGELGVGQNWVSVLLKRALEDMRKMLTAGV